MINSDTTTMPDEWKPVRLGDIAEIRSGNGFPLSRQGRRSGQYPFIKVSDMTLNGNEIYVNNANNFVDEKDVKELKATIFLPGTIVFPKVGAAISTNKKRVLTKPTIIDNNMVGVTVRDNGKCNARFLYAWFESIDLTKLANVSAVPSITSSRLKREWISLPTLTEQSGIATVLDSISEAIESIEIMKATTENLRDSLLHRLLTRGVPGWHTEWRNVPGIGSVPIDWKVISLEDCAFVRRNAINTVYNDSRPYIALENIVPKGSINGYGRAGDSLSPKTCFYEGDTLYGKLRPNLRKVARAMFDGVCSTDILAISASSLIDKFYLCRILQSNQLYRHSLHGVSGTRMPRTSWDHLKKFKFGLPSNKEQQIISVMLESVDETIRAIKAQVSQFSEFKEAIMESLLTGQVRIKER